MTSMFFFIPRVNEDIITEDIMNKSKYCLDTLFIKSMKVAGALVSTNDITTN